jgi:hypothetical protein
MLSFLDILLNSLKSQGDKLSNDENITHTDIRDSNIH